MTSQRSLTEVRDPKCTKCGLCETAQFVCLTGYGQVPSKIFIVGEAPGQREDDSGIPFVGKAGRLLDAILLQAGLSRDKAYISNAVHCRPPDNRKPTLDEIRSCRPYLTKEIAIIKPSIIITLGDTAIKGMFNSNTISISKARGQVLTLEEFPNVKIIATYHPAYALRRPEAAKWIFADIKNGLSLIENETPDEKLNYVEITKDTINSAYEDLMKTGEIVVDVETNGLDMFDPKLELLMIGFCNREGKAYIVMHDDHFSRIFTQKIFDNAKLIIGHNIKFDLKWLFSRGFTYKGPIFDTMIALHLLDENYPEHGLKHLARTELGTFGQQLIAYEQKIKEHWKNKTEPTPDEWIQYNGGDVDATFRLFKKFSWGLEKDGLKDLMVQEMKVLKVLVYMEMFGLKVCPDKHKELKKVYEKLILTKEAEVKRVLGDINLNSPGQLGNKLYDDLGFIPVKETPGGTRSVDEASLLELQKSCRNKVQKRAIESLMEFRGCQKIYSVYVDGLVTKGHIKADGKIHCNYKMLTVTGRLSCSDPNLQNIKRNEDEDMNNQTGKMNVKLMFVSSFPNGRLISGDYSQAELRILAHAAKDTNLIKAFESERDIHTEVATKVFNKKYDQITEAERKYTKQVNFGIVYAIGAQGLSRKLESSEPVAARLIKDWFRQFPDVKKWMDKMKLQVETEGSVTNIFGRKRRFFAVNPTSSEGREAMRQGVNAPIQGAAGDLTKWSMMRTHHALRKAGLKARVVVNVHDQIIIDSPESEVNAAAKILHETATHPPIQLLVPMKMDIKVGSNWGELTKYQLK